MSDTKENPKKIKDQKKTAKLTRADRLANALKKNMRLRKKMLRGLN